MGTAGIGWIFKQIALALAQSRDSGFTCQRHTNFEADFPCSLKIKVKVKVVTTQHLIQRHPLSLRALQLEME